MSKVLYWKILEGVDCIVVILTKYFFVFETNLGQYNEKKEEVDDFRWQSLFM